MQKEYDNVSDFLADFKNEISLKKLVIDMGIFKKEEFDRDFVKCIFHENDDKPSLQIKDEFFKCYACGTKGDHITFIENYQNLDFMDSVKFLANFLNIKINNIKIVYDGKSQELKNEWNKYLNNMQKAPKDIKEEQRNFFPQEIGYDSETEYLVFALTSKTGSILGFTKRRIDSKHIEKELGEWSENKEGEKTFKFKYPKWKHSSLKDSLIDQCHNVFNLYNANKEIKRTGEVILCEGPKDVIGYQRINKNNSICCCGTQNANNIWDIVFPIDTIVLSMDGDNPGVKATIKDILYLCEFFDIKNLFCVVLPKNEDPYSVKSEVLEECYKNKITASEFLINNGIFNDIKDFYNKVPDYNKTYVLKDICRFKGFDVNEAESWLNKDNNMNSNNNSKSEKDILLAFVKGEDLNDNSMLSTFHNISIEKAIKILKMKYGIEVK